MSTLEHGSVLQAGLYNHNVDTGIWPNSICKHACTKLSVKIRALHDIATILTSSGAESKGQKKSNRNEELKQGKID